MFHYYVREGQHKGKPMGLKQALEVRKNMTDGVSPVKRKKKPVDPEYEKAVIARDKAYIEARKDVTIKAKHGTIVVQIPDEFDPKVWEVQCSKSKGE